MSLLETLIESIKSGETDTLRVRNKIIKLTGRIGQVKPDSGEYYEIENINENSVTLEAENGFLEAEYE